MDERNPFPPQGGDSLPPPPPMYPVVSDIPPDSPYHASPAPTSRRTTGLLGGLGALLVAALAYGKYALLILVKIPFLLTAGTALVSVVFYSAFLGPWVAVGLVVMIFVHEMGHVVEIRRQGMAATRPDLHSVLRRRHLPALARAEPDAPGADRHRRTDRRHHRRDRRPRPLRPDALGPCCWSGRTRLPDQPFQHDPVRDAGRRLDPCARRRSGSRWPAWACSRTAGSPASSARW